MKLLLLSNSVNPGGGYLEQARTPIAELAGIASAGAGPRRAGPRRAVLLPFAGVTLDWDAYVERVRESLAPIGIEPVGAHRFDDPAAALADADLVLVGGGNTFRLLYEARLRGWLEPIRRAVEAGLPYVAWSAGSVLAGPTIRTTNDMPIIDPNGFESLGLIDFQLNCHYTDRLPPGHQGETRIQRLAEFHVLNPSVPVLGLPEGNWLEVRGSGAMRTLRVGGPQDAWVFRAGRVPEPVASGPLSID